MKQNLPWPNCQIFSDVPRLMRPANDNADESEEDAELLELVRERLAEPRIKFTFDELMELDDLPHSQTEFETDP